MIRSRGTRTAPRDRVAQGVGAHNRSRHSMTDANATPATPANSPSRPRPKTPAPVPEGVQVIRPPPKTMPRCERCGRPEWRGVAFCVCKMTPLLRQDAVYGDTTDVANPVAPQEVMREEDAGAPPEPTALAEQHRRQVAADGEDEEPDLTRQERVRAHILARAVVASALDEVADGLGVPRSDLTAEERACLRRIRGGTHTWHGLWMTGVPWPVAADFCALCLGMGVEPGDRRLVALEHLIYYVRRRNAGRFIEDEDREEITGRRLSVMENEHPDVRTVYMDMLKTGVPALAVLETAARLLDETKYPSWRPEPRLAVQTVETARSFDLAMAEVATEQLLLTLLDLLVDDGYEYDTLAPEFDAGAAAAAAADN